MCSGCQAARYCSKECQATAWKTHKLKCNSYKGLQEVRKSVMKESQFLLKYKIKMEGVLHKVEKGTLTLTQGQEALTRLKNKREKLEAQRKKALSACLKGHGKFAFYKEGNCYRERSYIHLPSP
jgi:hypothetical protein